MVRGLICLVTKYACTMRLESMSVAPFHGPKAAMEREPEEELHLGWDGSLPDKRGARERSHADEERAVHRGGGVVAGGGRAPRRPRGGSIRLAPLPLTEHLRRCRATALKRFGAVRQMGPSGSQESIQNM
jgi:hypothetical protein